MRSELEAPPHWASELVSHLPPLVPAKDAADFLGTTTRTLRRWVRVGRITVLRTDNAGSGRVLIPRSEIARLLASMRS